jgi:hypothetical protein
MRQHVKARGKFYKDENGVTSHLTRPDDIATVLCHSAGATELSCRLRSSYVYIIYRRSSKIATTPGPASSLHTSSLLSGSSSSSQAAAITTETTWFQTSDGIPLTLTGTNPEGLWAGTERNTLITFTIPSPARNRRSKYCPIRGPGLFGD